ncbi:hypothetical protein [Methylobacterium brachiatum]|uniref:hypothetical protein n=1 Tax=Methylobacterium brachiatum TaxID=269660 RepID=UPI002448F4EB|nr:hypothetical protein [Methylobacterium brachiatum]MDH2311458.1 hypothetical protein [Methylobacterium brachiatum]
MEQARPDSTVLPAAQIDAGQDHDISHDADARITRLLTTGLGPPLPAPGSEEAKAAFKAACHEHTIRTQFANEHPELKRTPLEWWTADSLGKALETGELTPAECARLYPLATERELRMAQIEHELNLGGLFALAFADDYPVKGSEPDADDVQHDSGADAQLLQLGRQFEAARKLETAACDACNAAQNEADRHMPERPAALFFRASDHPLRLGKYLTHPDDLEGNAVTSEDIAWMKRKPYVREVRRPVRPEDNLPAGARTVVDTFPWPEAQERADEIVTAWDAWHAEKVRIHGKYVTEALDDAANEAGDIATDLALRIADLPARTVAGFQVKLRALACYNPSFFYINPPELPDPDQALSHSLWRDVRDEAAPAIEPTVAPTSVVEPSPVFVAIADGTRSAADDALSDARVSPDLRKAVDAHRDATLAMLLETDESNEASDVRCGVVEQTGAALRAVLARSLADVRCKLAFLLPEILPDVNGETPTAFLENIRADVDRLAASGDWGTPRPTSDRSLVDRIDFASASLEDLQALRDLAGLVGGVAYAGCWQGRCQSRDRGEEYNAAGKLMQWLGDALTDVETAVTREAKRRRPANSADRETRLELLALAIIQNGNPDETAAFARELADHAAVEARGA